VLPQRKAPSVLTRSATPPWTLDATKTAPSNEKEKTRPRKKYSLVPALKSVAAGGLLIGGRIGRGQGIEAGRDYILDALPPVFCRGPKRCASTRTVMREGVQRILADIYKWRHLIENFFQKLKEFKRIAMRSDKTDASFSAIIYLAAAVLA
jgi:hypothetical protein